MTIKEDQPFRIVPVRSGIVRSGIVPVRSVIVPVRSGIVPVRSGIVPVQSGTLPVRSGIVSSIPALFRTWHYSGPVEVVWNSARAGKGT